MKPPITNPYRTLILVALVGAITGSWLVRQKPEPRRSEATAIAPSDRPTNEARDNEPPAPQSPRETVKAPPAVASSAGTTNAPVPLSGKTSPAPSSGPAKASISALPRSEQESLWSALHAARHAVSKLTDAEKAMPQNEGVKYFAFNPRQKLTARFLDGSVRIESSRNKDWAGTLRFDAGSEEATAPGFTSTADNRVEYQHPGGVTEWFVNRGNGIEHGFTVANRPAEAVQSGELRLTLAIEGLEARSRLDEVGAVADAVQFINPETGRAVLSYDHLLVWDANQQALPARLETAGSQVAIVVADAGATYPLTIDPLITSLEAKLEPEVTGDGVQGDLLGSQASLSGDSALIGAPGDDTAAGVDAGSAYVFVRTGAAWSLQQKLFPPVKTPRQAFGLHLSISGEIALIEDYVYVRQGNQWSLEAEIPGTGVVEAAALSGDTALLKWSSSYNVSAFVRQGTNWTQQADLFQVPHYGTVNGVAISGNTAVVGLWYAIQVGNDHLDRGKAYVFVRDGTNWTQQAEVFPSDPAAAPGFGAFIAIDGDTMLVGAPGYSTFPQVNGAAYVFVRNGANWTQQQKFVSATPSSITYGSWVAISGETALVGANQEDNPGISQRGAAYVYVRNGTTWTQQARFVTDSPKTLSAFGWSLALDGDTALIGVRWDSADAGWSDAGSARVFVRSGSTWSKQATLTAGDASAYNEFGAALAISGDTLLAGAPYDSSATGIDNGSAYLFTRTGAVWSVQAKLQPPTTLGKLGWSVALSGDTALIGAPEQYRNDNFAVGAVYVYVRSGSVWNQEAKIIASDANEYAYFGKSVALSGNTALIGAPGALIPGSESLDGAVYVFVRSGSAWSQQEKFTGNCNDDECYTLGGSVALSGDTAVIGDQWGYTLATSAGVARVYLRTGNTWNFQAELVPDGNTVFESFGAAVAIHGDRVLVGAPEHINPDTFHAGGAYVFRRMGTQWSQEALLEVEGPGDFDFAGSPVALSGGTAVLGVPTVLYGAAVVFQKGGSGWHQEAILEQPERDGDDFKFGCAIAMSGDTLVVGVSGDDSLTPETGEWRTDHGAAYVYRLPYELPAFVESVTCAGNQAVVNCTAEPGFTYDLERSVNLENWTAILTTNVPLNGLFLHLDLSSPHPMAAYRLKRKIQ